VKEAQRLWEENETLKEEIKQLEAQMGGLEEEKAFMESLIAKFADEKDDLAAKVSECCVVCGVFSCFVLSNRACTTA